MSKETFMKKLILFTFVTLLLASCSRSKNYTNGEEYLYDTIRVFSVDKMVETRGKDGTMVGAISNPPPYIREATQERILEFEHRKELLCKIHDYPFGKLSTEVLEKMYKLIKK